MRSATLPRRGDAHAQLTERQPPQPETTLPSTYSELKRLSSTPKKGVVSTSTEITTCPAPGAVYFTTGRWQLRISQAGPSWRLESNNTRLPFYIPASLEDEGRAIQHESETLGRDPISHVTYKGNKNIVTINLDMDDESDSSARIADVMIEDDYHEQKRSPASLELLETIYETLERITSDNRTLKAGKTVEILGGEFLRIQSVIRDITTTEIFLQGHRLRRAKEFEGLLEFKLNEVVMILEVDQADPRPVMVKGTDQIPLAQVGRIRELVITNRAFPELSFRERAHERPWNGDIANYGRLVCRWKYIVSFRTARDKQWNKYPETCLRRFRQSEVDSRSAVSDDLLRQRWRGDTVKGGACLDMPAEEEDFDQKERLASQASGSIRPTSSRRSSNSTVRDQAQSTGSRSSKTTTEFAIFSTSMSSSHPTGNRPHPFRVLDHDAETSVSPSVQVNLPDQASGNRRQAARHQIVIDITGDESPKISLNPLSLGESRGQSANKDYSHEDETPQSSWHQHTKPQRTGPESFIHKEPSPDIIEISAKVTAKSTSGVYTTRYVGPLPSSCGPYIRSTKRLKTTHRRSATSPIMDPAYSLTDARRGHLGKLWPAESVSLGQRRASTDLTDQTASSGITLKGPGQKTPADSSTFSALPRKQSLGQKTQSKQDPLSTKPRQKQRYTFGDAFCGAGGTSRGAKSAGFRVEWGFDFDLAAINSYRLNFYDTGCIVAWAHEFAEISVRDQNKVDVLHLSPPCQVFSWAHTVDGKDDEMNSATFFAVEELVKRTKPRVVTLENTSGLPILHPRWFNSAIQFFTRLGFSVRWKIMNFAEYGLVQARKRLIIIASW